MMECLDVSDVGVDDIVSILVRARYALDDQTTSGNDDLAEILWHKSLTAEKWLERRTNYTRSLAE
jgi:phosphatidylinositol kinase/protein kinase (PI-3  family)